MINIIFKKIIELLQKNSSSIFNIVDKLNLDYIIEKNNLEWKFNIINNINKNNNYLFINVKEIDLNFFMKRFCLIDFDKLQNNFDNKTIFCIDTDLFRKSYIKLLISLIINFNSFIYLIDEKNQLNFKTIKLKKFIKNSSTFSKLYNYDKYKFVKSISLFLTNNIYKKYKSCDFKNFKQTYDELLLDYNIIRFGDGEFDLMNGINHPYQKANQKVTDLINDCFIYFSNKKIAINDKIVANYSYLNNRHNYQFMNIQDTYTDKLKKIFSANVWSIPPYIWYIQDYSFLFQPYNINVNNKNYSVCGNSFYIETDIGKKSLELYKKIYKKIFDIKIKNKKCYLISGESNYRYLKNEILKNYHIEYISIPDYDAIDNIQQITNKLKTKIDKNSFFIISAGPVGKIIAKYLDENKISFLDVGNFFNYYDYYTGSLKLDDLSTIHKRKKFLKQFAK